MKQKTKKHKQSGRDASYFLLFNIFTFICKRNLVDEFLEELKDDKERFIRTYIHED